MVDSQLNRSKIFTIIIIVGFLGVITLNSDLDIFEITSQAFITNNSLKQYSILWNNTFGGDDTEIPGSIIQNDDGEYLLAGSIHSRTTDITKADVLIMEIDTKGKLLCNKTYGGARRDSAYGLVQTSDEEYVIAGITSSPFPAGLDVLLLKIDKEGNLKWNKSYDRAIEDELRSVIHTDDGGFAVLCFSRIGGGVGPFDETMWLIKTDHKGEVQWNRTYGELFAGFYDMIQSDDGGFVLAGFNPFGTSIDHMWLVKTNITGGIQWEKTYGGLVEGLGIFPADGAFSIIKTNDGGFALAGAISSYGDQYGDMWLVKTNASGDVEWNQTYGTKHTDYAKGVVQTPDGGYALAGITRIKANDSYPEYKQCLIKTSVIGEPEWNLTFSSQGNSREIIQTADGDLLLMGGYRDIWLIKIDLPPFAEKSDSIPGLDVFTSIVTLVIFCYWYSRKK